MKIDESYFGGKNTGGGKGHGLDNKTPVVGIVQRKGKLEARAVDKADGWTILPMIRENVVAGSKVYTDEYKVYDALPAMGHRHGQVPHAKQIYVRGQIHTNTIEGFWSNCKNGIRGVYHAVSAKYLQNYLNEYAFRYNHRDDYKPMFFTFLDKAIC